MARTITSPEQKMRIGHADRLIGKCNVALADPQITSRENQVLKRNQLLAGIRWRQVFDVIACIPSNARLESQAGRFLKKPTNPRRPLLQKAAKTLFYVCHFCLSFCWVLRSKVGRFAYRALKDWNLRIY
jgi:hypothetical protein